MSRTKSVPGIALGRWCTLGQTHYPVLGDKGPRREPPAIPSAASAQRFRPASRVALTVARAARSRKPMTVVGVLGSARELLERFETKPERKSMAFLIEVLEGRAAPGVRTDRRGGEGRHQRANPSPRVQGAWRNPGKARSDTGTFRRLGSLRKSRRSSGRAARDS